MQKAKNKEEFSSMSGGGEKFYLIVNVVMHLMPDQILHKIYRFFFSYAILFNINT